MDKETAQTLAKKVTLVLSSINETSTPAQDRDASEALLNLLKATILMTKLDDIEVTEDDKR